MDKSGSLLREPLVSVLPLSVVVAVANVHALAASAGGGRIRDLRVLRLARRLADQIDWNMLALAPQWIHAERRLASLPDLVILLSAGVLAGLAILLPLAILFSAATRFLIPASSRFRGPALRFALLLPPTIALSGQLPFRPALVAAVMIASAAIVLLLTIRLSATTLNRSLTIASALVVAALITGLASAPFAIWRKAPHHHEPVAGAPNIVLISIDSLRADHLHSYGYGRATSPNLDALAAEGSQFETVISPTSWTLPAHMTLLTSLPPEEHGVITNRFRLGQSIETMPERLRQNGYETAGFVSATYLDGLFGFSRGFDEYDDYTLLRVAGEKSRAAVTSRLVANRAISWLQSRKARPGQRPFFLFLHFFDVHYDYNPPAPYATMFDRAYTGAARGSVDSLHSGMRAGDRNHIVSLYDGEIAWVDANIGLVLAQLRAMGSEDNTIVVVTADHGEEFLDHGRAGHDKTLYDEVLRVPLLIRFPGHVAPGRRVDGQVRLMDIGPTIYSLAGLSTPRSPQQTEARSLACLLAPSKPLRRAPGLPAFGDLKGEMASLRTGDAKLIRNLRTHQEEFYDLSRDPLERHNVELSDQLRAGELRAMLDQWRTSSSRHSAVQYDLDGEDSASLRSLGYLK